MLPESSDGWDVNDSSFSQFGLVNQECINLFVAKVDIVDVIPDIMNHTRSITGNLIVLPSNKILEVTDSHWEVPGVNNLFTETDAKSVLKLSCKPYDSKLVQEINPQDVSIDPVVPYTTLDTYFNELINQTNAQNVGAETTPTVPTVSNNKGLVDGTSNKPPIDKTTSDVWGQF